MLQIDVASPLPHFRIHTAVALPPTFQEEVFDIFAFVIYEY
jgi:hypothetical protein